VRPDSTRRLFALRRNCHWMTMMTNPITTEIREIRHRLAAAFDNDLDLIFADLQRKERESGRAVIDRRGGRATAENHPTHRSGGGDVSQVGSQSPPAGDR